MIALASLRCLTLRDHAELQARRFVRRALSAGASISWSAAVAAAGRWQSPDPLCTGRAAVVRVMATRQVGW